LCTFQNRVPQGARTSNHIANCVIDSLLGPLIAFAKSLSVVIVNYGDDIALGGQNPESVRRATEFAQSVIRNAGLQVSEPKTVICEHRGGNRELLGCVTGRAIPDYPRSKYRMLRKELRSALAALRDGDNPGMLPIDSWRGKIAYIGRLNRQKAAGLRELFAAIQEMRKGRPIPACVSHSDPLSVTSVDEFSTAPNNPNAEILPVFLV
jgi:hypothetical protein